MKNSIDNTVVFCLPFAGGNKYSYRSYEKYCPSYLRLVTLEYPGRGSKLEKDLVTDLEALVDNLYDEIRNRLTDNYSIYGHSLGGQIANLLTQRIYQNKNMLPRHVFITGCKGPSTLHKREKILHTLAREEFIKELEVLNGIPKDLLSNEDFMNYTLPILRADFSMLEKYVYRTPAPSNVNYTIITGTSEDMTTEDIHEWRKETTGTIDFKKLPGDHFFIFKHPHIIVEQMQRKIAAGLT